MGHDNVIALNILSVDMFIFHPSQKLHTLESIEQYSVRLVGIYDFTSKFHSKINWSKMDIPVITNVCTSNYVREINRITEIFLGENTDKNSIIDSVRQYRFWDIFRNNANTIC